MRLDTAIRARRRPVALALLAAALSASLLLAACAEDEPEPTPTQTPAPTVTMTPTEETTPPPTETPTRAATETPGGTSTAAPTAEPGDGAPPAPTNVVLEGELPDTDATVPAGGGELGRVSIVWEYEGTPEGFRIYTMDCDGEVAQALEVEGSERMYGPMQPCRPGGNIGVAAFEGGEESEIAWAEQPE